MVALVVKVDHTLHVDAEIIGLYQPASSCACQPTIVPLADYVGDVALELLPIGYVVSCLFHEFRHPLVAPVIALECLSRAAADGPRRRDRCLDVVLALAPLYHTAVVPVIRGVGVAPVVVFIM